MFILRNLKFILSSLILDTSYAYENFISSIFNCEIVCQYFHSILCRWHQTFLWLIRPIYSTKWKVEASSRQKQLSTKVLIQTKRLPFCQDMQIGIYYRNNTHTHTSKCSYGSVKSLHAIGNVDWIGCSSNNQILQ